MEKMDKKAFTLIELIVVIAVVGILVLLGAPRFTGYTQRAELTRIQHDVKVMEQEIGVMLINEDDDFNKWENNSKDFNQLIQENKLFDNEGVVEEIEDLSVDKTYKVTPEKYEDKINTKLKGTFYANSGGKVYYEHVKPLFKNPTGPENPGPEEPGEPGEPGGPGGPGENDLVCSYGDVNNKEGLMNPIGPRKPIGEEIAIDSAVELAKIGTEYPFDGDYILTANIDLSNIENWTPIGSFNTKTPFIGSFDGNGYKITGLTINGSQFLGLFGYTDGAIISNVALEDINVTGSNTNIGGLVGSAENSTMISNSYATGSVTGSRNTGGLVGSANNSTEITNSYATASTEVIGSGRSGVGGLVGRADGGTIISNSYATGSVTGRISVGGLAGWAGGGSTIDNSCATGPVNGTKDGTIQAEHAGGLVGMASGGTISNSYSTGEVIGGNNVGGFVGVAQSGNTISKSYATGSVDGKGYVGGFVGKYNGGTIDNSYASNSVAGESGQVGGFVGWNEYRATISNSYSTGPVTKTRTSTRSVGAFVGYVDGRLFPINNSYWDTETTEIEESTGYYQNSSRDGVVGKTTAEMKQSATYTDGDEGWDFESIWKIEEGKDYPKLR